MPDRVIIISVNWASSNSGLMEGIELGSPSWQARMFTTTLVSASWLLPFAFCRLIYHRRLLWCVRMGRLDARGRRRCTNWLWAAALGQGQTTCNGNGAQLCQRFAIEQCYRQQQFPHAYWLRTAHAEISLAENLTSHQLAYFKLLCVVIWSSRLAPEKSLSYCKLRNWEISELL